MFIEKLTQMSQKSLQLLEQISTAVHIQVVYQKNLHNTITQLNVFTKLEQSSKAKLTSCLTSLNILVLNWIWNCQTTVLDCFLQILIK